MQTRDLGQTGLRVSELGFGCSSYWAKPRFSEQRAVSLVEQAVQSGITFFDSGPSYAAGNAEQRLGKALKLVGRRDDLIICSKIGTHVSDDGRLYRDWSPVSVKRSIQGSLKRLGTDRLDGLHLHGPSIENITPSLCEALQSAKQEGLISFVGINSFDPDVVRHCLSNPLFDSFMIEYNVLHKRHVRLIDEITMAGRAAIIGTPLAQTLFRKSIWPGNLKEVWELARALANHRPELLAARRYGFLNTIPEITGPQAALAYVLRNRQLSTAIFGTTSADHLRHNIEATKIDLPPDILARIESLSDAG